MKKTKQKTKIFKQSEQFRLIPNISDIEILGYWDIGILGYWDIGILRYLAVNCKLKVAS
jgi:hypothetical protein